MPEGRCTANSDVRASVRRHEGPVLADRAFAALTGGQMRVVHPQGLTLRADMSRSTRREVSRLPRNTRQTSAKAAKAASKVLSSSKSSKAAKSAAGSALSQTPKRGKR